MSTHRPIPHPIPHPLPLPTTKDKRSIIPLPDPDPSIDLSNIQGDVYPTFPKKAERFIFFKIRHVTAFRERLGHFRTHITTAADVIENLRQVQDARIKNKGLPKPLPKERLVRLEQYQIGFSHASFQLLNITGDIKDVNFTAGPQILQAKDVLGDRPTGTGPKDVDWDPIWKTHTIHGVIVAASESEDTCDESVAHVRRVFGTSIHIINVLHGKVRPDAEEGHEHFGFLDGISQPAIIGLADPHPGQLRCEAGVIIMGGKNDPQNTAQSPRPTWTKDGSMMAFRKLQQLVPEFDRFLLDHPLNLEGLSPEEASALRGAKMVGRWKSGAPVEIATEKDDQDLADDPDRNNNFDFGNGQQSGCPFSAHIRKTAPRKTIPERFTIPSQIVRAGIPYGPEVSDEEKSIDTTIADRGLLFVSYQSTLDPGFVFLQRTWANNPTFPPRPEGEPAAGLDPVIGNKHDSNRERDATGEDPNAAATPLTMPCDFVVAKGGEYFFVPSISTLRKISNGEELGPAAVPTPQPAVGGQAPLFNTAPPPPPGTPGGPGAPPNTPPVNSAPPTDAEES